MWEDPIVAEVHRAREELMARYNFDMDAMFADIRKRQALLGDRVLPVKKRSEALTEHGCSTGSLESTTRESSATYTGPRSPNS